MADHVQKRFADLTAAFEDAAGLASDGQAIELNKAKIDELISQIDIHLERARPEISAIRRLAANLD